VAQKRYKKRLMVNIQIDHKIVEKKVNLES